MDDTEKIAAEIRRELPAEKYGLKEWLMGDLYSTRTREYYVKMEWSDVSRGYDCFGSALRIRSILERHGRPSRIANGKSEDRVFQGHTYVIDSEGLVWDGTPFYPTIGAKHATLGLVVEHRVKSDSKEGKLWVSRQGFVAKTYLDGEENTCVGAGAGSDVSKILPYIDDLRTEKGKKFRLPWARIKAYTPKRGSMILTFFQPKELSKFSVPENASKDEMAQWFKEAKANGTITVVEHFSYNGDDQSHPLSEAPDLKEKLDDNTDLLCTLIQNAAFPIKVHG